MATDELWSLDVNVKEDMVNINTNSSFEIWINGKRLGSFRVDDNKVHMILHPDRFKGMVWIATDKMIDDKKSSGQRWVDLV